jgi:hypothetical protein
MTLKEFLEFTFQDSTHFIGILILMSMLIGGLVAIAEIVSTPFKRK